MNQKEYLKLDSLKETVLGKMVKITADFNFRGVGRKEIKTVVGTVVDINKWGIEIGHPIFPSTNEMADCGARNSTWRATPPSKNCEWDCCPHWC